MTARSELEPEDDVFRFLFASPARFVGNCFGDGFDLTVAFQSYGRASAMNRSRINESYMVFSIRTPPHDRKTIKVETYEWAGEELSALLGAYYGKLIVNKGHIQSGNIFTIPTEITVPEGDRERTPFNNAVRKPDGPEISLVIANRVVERYFESYGEDEIGSILRGAEFYRLALENFHSRPEITLAMFCSTIEAMLEIRKYSEDELYDAELLTRLRMIKEHCPDGEKLMNYIKARLFQVKRKFVAFVNHYLPDTYFVQPETELGWGVPKGRDDLIRRMKNVYDLRSIVLHTGNRSGLWFLEHDHQRSEIGGGSPILGDKKLEKMLSGGLTLTGLERVTATLLRAVINEWLGPIPPTEDCPLPDPTLSPSTNDSTPA